MSDARHGAAAQNIRMKNILLVRSLQTSGETVMKVIIKDYMIDTRIEKGPMVLWELAENSQLCPGWGRAVRETSQRRWVLNGLWKDGWKITRGQGHCR